MLDKPEKSDYISICKKDAAAERHVDFSSNASKDSEQEFIMKLFLYLTAAMLLAAAPITGWTAEKKVSRNTQSANPFESQQKKIKALQDKLAKARKGSEKRRLTDQLEREQNALKTQLGKKLAPLQQQLEPLKAHIRLESNPARKEKVQKELDAVQAEIESITKVADLEKWGSAEAPKDEMKDMPAPTKNKSKGKSKNRSSRKKK